MIGSIVIAALSGFAMEFSSVFWTHFHQSNQRNRLALVSALQGTALVCGAAETAHNWSCGPAFVFGYASGAYVAMGMSRS